MKKILIFTMFMCIYFSSIPVGAAEEIHSEFYVAGAADGVRYEYKPLFRVVADKKNALQSDDKIIER